MRIAVDGRPLRHPFVGIGVYTREILSRIGRDHELFIYLDRDLPEPPDIPGVYRAGSGRRLTGLLTANVVFPRWARQDAVDVFFSPRHHLPLALRDVPSVVTIHDLVWRVAPETMKPLNRALDAMLMPIALAQADRVIAVSQDTANRIEAFCGRSDVGTVMLAPRQLPPPEPFEHGRPFFLFVGTKEPRKNLPGTLDGFRRAVAAGLDHDLVLAGSDGWEPGIAERIAASGLSDRVVDLGPISSARLAGVYQACSALVLASFYEGFGIPLVEAMAHGRPVITSSSGAMAEIADDAALFVDPANAASIARAFLKLERDQDTRQRLAANAHRRAKSFSWDRAARETVEVLATASAPHWDSA